jgi:cobalamin biosynthesis Mg chelatase CobN
MLSAPAYRELLELRRAVRAYLKEPSDSELLSQLKREIWHRKNGLRTAMRADLGLLFEEDQ